MIRYATLNDINIILQYDTHISKNELENIINLKRVLLMFDDNRFIGWLRYNLFWDSIPFMNMLYILDEYQNKGFGKALVNYWETEMKLLNYNILLTSTVEKENAKSFYQKLGYKIIGGFTIPNDEYEIIMYKGL